MKITTLLVPALFLLATPLAPAQEATAKKSGGGVGLVEAPAASDADVIAAQKPSYPLKTCVISGEELGSMGDPIEHVVDGRLVRLCCKGCVKGVGADKAAAFAKIDAGVIRAQKPSYPLKTCVVAGEPLGADAVDHVHGTRLVRLCCNDCKASFAKKPDGYMAKIDAALIEAQRASYPLKTCVISGEPLGDDARDHLHGTTLVRFCCSNCERTFAKSPEKFMAEWEAAVAKAKGKG
jgi:YHS domain-containing protein